VAPWLSGRLDAEGRRRIIGWGAGWGLFRAAVCAAELPLNVLYEFARVYEGTNEAIRLRNGEEQKAEGDAMVIRWAASSTQDGEPMRIATCRRVTILDIELEGRISPLRQEEIRVGYAHWEQHDKSELARDRLGRDLGAAEARQKGGKDAVPRHHGGARTIVLDDDKRLRGVLGPRLQRVMESGKVQASGFLGGKRGAFFLLDIDFPEEFYGLFGPETYSTCTLEAYPVIPMEKGGQIFQQWAEEGR
jgi:hypothetical protein